MPTQQEIERLINGNEPKRITFYERFSKLISRKEFLLNNVRTGRSPSERNEVKRI